MLSLFSRSALFCGVAFSSSACRSIEVADWSPPSARAPRVALERASSALSEPRQESVVALPEQPSLEDYLAHARAHSQRLRAAHERWSAATQAVAQARTWDDPQLSYTEFLEEVQTRTGPQQRRIGLTQRLPKAGELDAREDAARANADAEWFALEQVRLELEREVSLAYHAFALTGRELELRGELLSLLHGLEPVVQARVRSGAGQEDVLRLQVEIGRLEDICAQLERRRPVLSAALAAAVGADPQVRELEWPELAEPEPSLMDLEQERVRVLDQSPELAALAARVLAARAQMELAGVRKDPTISLGVDYFQTSAALDPSTPGSSDDPLALRFGLSLPIWGGSYAAGEREARHRARAMQADHDDASARLLAELEGEAFNADDALRRLALYRDSLIPRAEEALQLTLAAYRAGNATLLDLIDSERSLLEFEISYWRACYDSHAARVRLTAMTGGSSS